MRPVKLLVPILTLMLLMVMVSQSYADLSNAAVLYLRIAPGARAAAMGEAYVAIADDATSTHWNPAGLGTYPLSPGWVQTSVPEDLQPITGMAVQKTRRGGTYEAFDIWAITPKGLARYDNKEWYLYEVFDTKTDQTVQAIVSSYFNITDADKVAEIVEKVARSNNEKEYAYLDSLKNAIMETIPADYSAMRSLTDGFDSLLAGYNLCLVNWERVAEIEKRYADGMKDSALTEQEIDRINFAVEKARTRFIPEQLTIQYSELFSGELVGIESFGDHMLLATDSALYANNGRRWMVFTTKSGLPSNNITSLKGTDLGIFIGTDKGVVRYDGGEIDRVGKADDLPEGAVRAMALDANEELWAVVNDELFRFNGSRWVNWYEYTVVIDDTPERIAEKLTVYGTEAEKQAFIAKLTELNTVAEQPVAEEPSVAQADSGAVIEEEVAVEKETVETAKTFKTFSLEPGKQIKVPYVTAFKGGVNTMLAETGGRLWFGTDYGVVYFDENRWHLPGYRETSVEARQTFADMLILPGTGANLDADAYRTAVWDINDLTSEEVVFGQKLKVYRNPTAAPVHKITYRSGKTYFATALGVLEYDGTTWSRVDHHDLHNTSDAEVLAVDDELWFADENKIVAKANSRTDISMMYVKWLPELADDLYYAFASFASHKEGWGTFGGNFTYISYGTITRTGDEGQDLGTFESFDLALTGSWGTSINDKLKGGISAKLLYSKLADQGAGEEQGRGTSTGFAVDFGFLYHFNRKMDLGLAITNLGPDMAYIDAAQSDPLPRNFAFGVAYKVLQTDYYHFLVTAEVNKSLVGVDDSFREELKQLVLNGGGEFLYGNILALRAGYIYDQEGDIKTATLGIGLGPVGIFKFDFSYIPSTKDGVLDNTLRISFAVQP